MTVNNFEPGKKTPSIKMNGDFRTKFEPKLDQNQTKMGPKWDQNGSEMDPKVD